VVSAALKLNSVKRGGRQQRLEALSVAPAKALPESRAGFLGARRIGQRTGNNTQQRRVFLPHLDLDANETEALPAFAMTGDGLVAAIPHFR
jgi:hypothetical protein